MRALSWIAVDVVIGEQTFDSAFSIAACQTDDNHVHMSLATRIRSPCEGPVGERNFKPTTVKQDRPKLCHLLTLRN